jgi:phage terminase large subunit-like protein
MTHSEVATQYAEQVCDGTIIACKWVKLAAQRHIDDLARTDFEYSYDSSLADRACEFIECLPHTKGAWFRRRELLTLQPWQAFIVCSIFGWISKATKFRRYQEAYICCPRKQGKSPLAAGIALYMTACDGEAGAEVFCGATTEKQAWEVFRPARFMVERTKDLREALGFRVNAKSLVVEADGSKFEPVIGKPGDGASPSCGICDEYHEAETSDLYDTLKTGMIGRDQPLLLTITTAGFNIASPCHDLQITAQQILEGSLDDPNFFALIYTIDEDTDWTSEAALWMANPNMGVSINAERLRHDQLQAVQNAAKANTFKTKHLCIWCSADSAFFNMAAWNEAADTTLDEADFATDPCYIGVDLASLIDLSAVVKVYVRRIEGKLNYYVFPRHYLPEDRIDLPENQHYQKWQAGNNLIATEGAALDYALVREGLASDIGNNKVEAVCYDERYCRQLMQELNLLTYVTLCEVPQIPQHLSLPMKSLDAAILDGRIHHNGDPVLTWCMSNVVTHADKNDNVFPNKLKAAYKIDGAVALINAMNRAITCDSIVDQSNVGFFFA